MDRPRHGDAFSAPPPDLAYGGRSGSGGSAPAPAPRAGNSFIRGGQLHTVVEGGAGAGGSALGGAPRGTSQPQTTQPALPPEGNGQQGEKVCLTRSEPYGAPWGFLL